jgi:hypothetical protein
MAYAVAAALLLVGVALFVSAPLYGEPSGSVDKRPDAQREGLEHDRAQAVQGLRELELDRQMNKLSRADYARLRARLEARALRAMAGLEQLNPTAARGWSMTGSRAQAAQSAPGRRAADDPAPPQGEALSGDSAAQTPIVLLPNLEEPKPAPNEDWLGRQPRAPAGAPRPALRTAFCPACGARLNAWAKFCSACGTRLSAAQ